MVEFDVRNVKRRRLQAMLDDSKVRQVFAMGVRDYLVNGMHWKVCFVCGADSVVRSLIFCEGFLACDSDQRSRIACRTEG